MNNEYAPKYAPTYGRVVVMRGQMRDVREPPEYGDGSGGWEIEGGL